MPIPTEQHNNNIIATITTEYIELDKLLKRENLTASGGEARYLISQGLAQVNSIRAMWHSLMELRCGWWKNSPLFRPMEDETERTCVKNGSLPGEYLLRFQVAGFCLLQNLRRYGRRWRLLVPVKRGEIIT